MTPKDTTPPATPLAVNEIFASIQGESSYAGRPCVFVRTAGCNLRCTYCDTTYAFSDGTPMSIADVMTSVAAFGLPLVEVTGGEPLLQAASLLLLRALCDGGYEVLLETNGAVDIGRVDSRVVRIVDFKAPSSGHVHANAYENVAHLRAHDEVKLVLADRADYEWARALLREHGLAGRCQVLIGPVFGRIAPRDLATWILEDKLPVRLQVQLHKIIWDPSARGV